MPAEHHRPRGTRPGPGARLDAVILWGLVALCSAALSGLAWTHPTQVPSALRYTQSGQLTYRAAAEPGSVYGTHGVSTGEPVYTHEVSRLSLRYSYQLTSPGTAAVAGTEQLVASISNGQGISRTIPLQPVTAFAGRAFRTTARFRLAALEAVAHAFDMASGTNAVGSYAVQVRPEVHIHGRLGPATLRAAFDAPISFTLGFGELAPGSSPPTVGVSAPSPPSALSSTRTASLRIPVGRPATMLAGLRVADVRVIALLLLAGSVCLTLLLGRPLLRRATSVDERVRIATRYGSQLVEIHTLPAQRGLVVVRVSSFEGLRQVARRLELPILHRAGGDVDVYAVVDNGTLYRYGADDAQPIIDAELTRTNGHAVGVGAAFLE